MTGQTLLAYPDDATDPQFLTKLAAWQAQTTSSTPRPPASQSTGKVSTSGSSSRRSSRAPTTAPSLRRRGWIRASSRPSAPAASSRRRCSTARSRPSSATGGASPTTGPTSTTGSSRTTASSTAASTPDSITSRLDTTANGIIGAVASRFSNEASCAITAWDFTKTKASRAFFPKLARSGRGPGVGRPRGRRLRRRHQGQHPVPAPVPCSASSSPSTTPRSIGLYLSALPRHLARAHPLGRHQPPVELPGPVEPQRRDQASRWACRSPRTPPSRCDRGWPS